MAEGEIKKRIKQLDYIDFAQNDLYDVILTSAARVNLDPEPEQVQ